MRNVPPSLLGLLILATTTAFGDEFDRLEADRLQQITTSGDSKKHERLTINAIEALPQALRDARSAFLVVKTDQGNYARLLVSQALRKAPGARARLFPFSSSNASTRLNPARRHREWPRGREWSCSTGSRSTSTPASLSPRIRGATFCFRPRRRGVRP